MAGDLTGSTISTKNLKKIRVEALLGEGGQGEVYKVDYDGQPKALKWYTTVMKNPKKFYENLENNIKKGAPTNAFLWPEDITEQQEEKFGYIMDLRPPEYVDFRRFLVGKEGFASITAMVNAALRITEGFRELHSKGYSYQDLNDGNFFINPKNGEVLICDNDNVFAYGKNSGIAGKARYMAPEVVLGKSQPDMMTDRFSLAVVLFLLFTGNHPLEGKNTCPPCMTPKLEKIFFGENPVFIFDPTDDSNRPVQGLHKGAIGKWPHLPKYLQDEFIKVFSKELLADPSRRIIDQEWLRLFIRLRGEVFKCPCGEVYFADPVNPNPCPACGKTNPFIAYIKTPRYNLPLHQRTKLYACHTEKGSDDFQTLTGEAILAGNAISLKNVSGKKWSVTVGDNTSVVESNQAVGIAKGMAFNFGNDASAEII
ncbi:hypothetical protein FACS189496_4740 [Bacilli bacterium]|nr:hypothetical protein FACS189496_4740 [Bacilli bacterium]